MRIHNSTAGAASSDANPPASTGGDDAGAATDDCPPVPSVWLTEDWQCDGNYTFCRDIQASALVSKGQLAAALAPHGHTGDRARLLEQAAGAWRSKQLNIMVIGNLITSGEGCGTEGAWPMRLRGILRRGLFPWWLGVRVSVDTLAEGGSTSMWAVSALQRHAERLAGAHVVFVDLSMSDTPEVNKDDITEFAVWTRALVAALRALPSAPAIVYVETLPYKAFFSVVDSSVKTGSELPWCSSGTEEAREAAGAPHPLADPCALDARCFPHWRALERLGVPVVDYFGAACAALPRQGPFVANGSVPYWRPGSGNAGPQHPSCDTHEVIAHLAAELLNQALRSACLSAPPLPPAEAAENATRNATGGDVAGDAPAGAADEPPPPVPLPPPPPNPWDVSQGCLARGTTTYDAVAGAAPPPPYNSSGERSGPSGPPGFPCLDADANWAYAEDVRGRPGWMSLPGPGPAGEVVFEVTTSLGDVVVEYSATRADAGWAFCRVGTGPMSELAAPATGLASTSAFVRLRAVPRRGVHNLTCASAGLRVKLLSVRAC